MVRLTDHPDMTLDVYRGRKTTIQHISEKPSQPILSSQQHFQHICSNCIALLSGISARLRCNVDRGTPPISMKLYLDGLLFASKPNATRTLSKLTPVINEMHGFNLTCEVSNAALSSPLILSKSVYVVCK